MRLRTMAAATVATALLIPVLLSVASAQAGTPPSITDSVWDQSAHVTGAGFTPSGPVYVEIDKGFAGGQIEANAWLTAAGPHVVCSPFPFCRYDPGGEITWDVAVPPQFCYTYVVIWAWDQDTRQYSNVTPPADIGCTT
jgi:hypothetical protein